MRSSAIVLGLALLSPLAFAGSASARTTPSDVRDLVGARGSSGENALTTRGYVMWGQMRATTGAPCRFRWRSCAPVEVYLMRDAARRGERAHYTLDVSAGR